MSIRAPNQPDDTRRRLTSRPAFTIIEVIVVIILLSMVSTVMVVRLSDNLERRGEVVVRQVESLLETLAHRQVIGQNRVAIVFDAEFQELRLETLLQERDEDEPQWRIDPLTPVVAYDDLVTVTSIRLDGAFYDESFQQIMPIEDVRPAIEVTIEYGDRMEIVELLPHEMRAYRQSDWAMDRDRPAPVDLDALGQSEVEW